MTELIIHIGLPKTATTTLQVDFFPKLHGKYVNYLGVRQPRGKTQEELYKKFMQVIRTGKNIDFLREELSNISGNSLPILLSDETIVGSELNGMTWRSRLKILAQIIEGFDYKIIVTIREPVSAMFSYYVEFYERFHAKGFDFYSAARDDESMEIYHYAKLFKEIDQNLDISKVTPVTFENIIQGKLDDFSEIFGINENYQTFQLNINNARQHSTKYTYKEQAFTIKTYIFLLFQSLNLLQLTQRSSIKPLTQIFKKLPNPTLYKKEIVISRPTEYTKDKLRNWLKDETNTLGVLFEIYY